MGLSCFCLAVLKRNAFVMGLGAAVILAWLTPKWGARGGVLHSELWMRLGVVVIFLAQGFNLSTASLASGLINWRLHVFTQGWISLGAPLLALGGITMFGAHLEPDLRIALFFLSILPTTVSSAVALIAEAEGDVAGGIFNTVVSNLLGVVVVPAAVVWYVSVSEEAASLPLWPTLRSTITVLLLPFVVGRLLQSPLHRIARSIKAVTRPVSQAIICFMVYASFATSFRDAVWETVGFTFAWHGLVAACGLLAALSTLAWASGRVLFPAAPDRIAAFYCGSQKSLAAGVPYATAIFSLGSNGPDAGAVLLPLLFYHPIQLFLGAGLIRLRSRLFG